MSQRANWYAALLLASAAALDAALPALPVLPWSPGGPSCNTDFCGELWFCATTSGFGYSLPNTNCTPGRSPIIRVTPGKAYTLSLFNAGVPGNDYHTGNLYVNGLYAPNDGNGNDPTRKVVAGNCLKYVWRIPADHLGGTLTYHSWVPGALEGQLSRGAVGQMVVEEAFTPTFPPNANTQLFMNQAQDIHLTVTKVDGITRGNGLVNEVVQVNAEEWYRLRISLMDPEGRPDGVAFGSGCDVHVIAYDGVWTPLVPENAVSLAAGTMVDVAGQTRLDAAIRCRAGASFTVSAVFHLISQVAMTITSATSGAPSLATPFNNGLQWSSLESRPAYLSDLQTTTPAAVVNIKFTAVQVLIESKNKFPWDIHAPLAPPLVDIPINTTQEWIVLGTNRHPFSMSGRPFQIWGHFDGLIRLPGDCGPMHKQGYWYTTLSAALPGSLCIIRFKPQDFGGRIVAYNTFLVEGDSGSIGWFNVINGPAIDSTNLSPTFTCAACTPLPGSCTAINECGTVDGRDSCGNPCSLATLPKCAGNLICNTENRCTQPITPPTTLAPFPWNDICDPPAVYDFCGVLEFCTAGVGQYGYRIPGAPCIPGKGPLVRLPFALINQLRLRNTASEPANWNILGAHYVADGNGLNISREAAPGECLPYFLDSWAANAGTFVYHAAVAGSMDRHVSGGAYGMAIVDDDVWFGPSPEVRNWMHNELLLLTTNIGGVVRGNGNLNEPLRMIAGEWYRLRIAVVNPAGSLAELNIGGGLCTVHAVAYDGIWTFNVPESLVPKHIYQMAGFNRLDVAVKCSATGLFDVTFAGGVAAKLYVVPGTVSTATPFVNGDVWQSFMQRYPHLQDLQNQAAVAPAITVSMAAGTVNGVPWNAATPFSDIPADTVKEYILQGTGAVPVHSQTWPLQVVTPGGCNNGLYRQGEFYDVISSPTDCTVRTISMDFSGRWLWHAINLAQADAGAMGWYNIINGHPLDFTDMSPVCPNAICIPAPVAPESPVPLCVLLNQCGVAGAVDSCGGACAATPAGTCPVDMVCSAAAGNTCQPLVVPSPLPSPASPSPIVPSPVASASPPPGSPIATASPIPSPIASSSPIIPSPVASSSNSPVASGSPFTVSPGASASDSPLNSASTSPRASPIASPSGRPASPVASGSRSTSRSRSESRSASPSRQTRSPSQSRQPSRSARGSPSPRSASPSPRPVPCVNNKCPLSNKVYTCSLGFCVPIVRAGIVGENNQNTESAKTPVATSSNNAGLYGLLALLAVPALIAGVLWQQKRRDLTVLELDAVAPEEILQIPVHSTASVPGAGNSSGSP